uniref:Uncharacterized protein n=1 Tax=Avena sativa TaxID=4498 RepID=A0ACD5YIH2_AVESA
MGDRPWQQPHEQASCSAHTGMIQQASSAATSSIHGSIIRKDPNGYDDMGELDQALFLYLNSQDQTSIQEQPQTLNIFPSRPMHAPEPSPNAATPGSSKQQRPPPKQPAMLAPAPGGKATVKREGTGNGGTGMPSTSEQEGPRTPDAKTLRRLAQNREAARKSRLRKKAYIQNLETSRVRLSQMEQEMQRGSNQGAIMGGGAGVGGLSPEAAWFDGEYARWVDEHDRMMRHLRAAVEDHNAAPAMDGERLLRQLVDAVAAHHVVLAELKAAVARADVFHIISGTWLPAAERCFLWIGGSRPSDLIKVVARHVEPLTEQQVAGVCDVQRWSREREGTLDQELQATYNSLSDTICSDALLSPYPDMTAYMAHMSLAIANLSSLEAFVRQADALRLQVLHRLPQILTPWQVAQCFLAIADYSQRLRALSSLWLARPRHQDQPATPSAGAGGCGRTHP